MESTTPVTDLINFDKYFPKLCEAMKNFEKVTKLEEFKKDAEENLKKSLRKSGLSEDECCEALIYKFNDV